MLMPKDFIDSVPEDAKDAFLNDLILSYAGSEGYEGELAIDRARLIEQLKRGELVIEYSEVNESFALLTKIQAGVYKSKQEIS